MPACAAISSRLVAANPLRANASVAAASICSRRCARGRRRSGAGFPSINIALPSLIYSQGEAEIERLLVGGELQELTGRAAQGGQWLSKARRTLSTAAGAKRAVAPPVPDRRR